MYYPVCRMVHIKHLLLLIGKNSRWSGSSRFPLVCMILNYRFNVNHTKSVFECTLKSNVYFQSYLERDVALLKECSLMVQWFVRAILHARPIKLFLVPTSAPQLVNKSCGICYPVCGMMHIKEPLLLIGKSSPCSADSRFPLLLYEWSFTICPTQYTCMKNVLSASLKKTFPSFLPSFSLYLVMWGFCIKLWLV